MTETSIVEAAVPTVAQSPAQPAQAAPAPAPAAAASSPTGVLDLVGQLVRSGKVTATAVSLAVVVLGGPWGVAHFLGPHIDRYLELRQAELAIAVDVERLVEGAATRQQRIAALEVAHASLAEDLREVATSVNRAERNLLVICSGLDVRCEGRP